MTKELLHSYLRQEGVKDYKLRYRNIYYADFGEVHSFPNTLYMIERIRLYGKTTLGHLNNRNFVIPVINNIPTDITGSITVSKIQKNGSDYYVEVMSDEILFGDTKLTFDTNNLLLDEVYRGYARIIEIIPLLINH